MQAQVQEFTINILDRYKIILYKKISFPIHLAETTWKRLIVT